MANCPAACSLSLPPPQDAPSSKRSTPRTTWSIGTTTPRQGQLKFLVWFERDPSSNTLKEVIRPPSGSELSATVFCSVCEFCQLVREVLRERHGPPILDWLLTASAHVSRPQVLVELEKYEFTTQQACWLIDGRLTKTGDPFVLVLRGKQSLTQGGALLQEKHDIVVPLELYAEEGGPAAEYYGIHRRPLEAHALNDLNIEKLKAWLSECDGEHHKCSEPSLQEELESEDCEELAGCQFVPTRLLDVGDPRTGRHPKLVVSREHFDEDQTVKYFALSYCWGDEVLERPPTTTRQNYLARLEKIPYQSLPKTFRDVIDLARALGVQYVWIDSLCIVQDLRRDWGRESGQMRNIFNTAYLTVIAAAASSSHDGFLNRDIGRTCTLTIEEADADAPDPAKYSYSVRQRPGRKWWGADKLAGITGRRWIERGWTFQEERLAKRVLMFGNTKFFFDCRTFERMEDSELLQPRPDWSKTLYGVPGDDMAQSVMSHASDVSTGEMSVRQRMQPGVFDHWQTLCNHYSRRQLTFEEDKLPALSGMASMIDLKVKSEYLAGLWKDHIYHDLFWQTKGTVSKPNRYRAPSWSWASLKAEEIQWKYWYRCLDDNCKRYSEILDIQTTVPGPDRYGVVSDGLLRISGPVIQVRLTWDPVDNMARHPWKVSADGNGNEIARADLDLHLHDNTQGSEGLELTAWALLVAKCTGDQAPPRGFILNEAQRYDLQERTFERAGIFRIYPESSSLSKAFLARWERMRRQELIII